MKKLLALLVAGAFVAGCSSSKEPTPHIVVVKHHVASGVHKHHHKDANVSSTKMGE